MQREVRTAGATTSVSSHSQEAEHQAEKYLTFRLGADVFSVPCSTHGDSQCCAHTEMPRQESAQYRANGINAASHQLHRCIDSPQRLLRRYALPQGQFVNEVGSESDIAQKLGN